LLQRGVNRVIGDVPSALAVACVAHADVAVDVQDTSATAWAVVDRSDAKGIAVRVLLAVNRTPALAASPCLGKLALEVVQRVLTSGDAAIKLIEATIIDCSQSEGEASWDSKTESNLAVLPVRAGGNSGSRLSTELIERDSNSGLGGVEGVSSGARRASRTVQPQGSYVERARSSLPLLNNHWGGEGTEDKRGDDGELHCLDGLKKMN